MFDLFSSADSRNYNGDDVLLFWRERVFSIIYTCACIFAVFPFIASILKVATDRSWINFTVYAVIYGLSVFILIVKKIPFPIRSILGIASFYLLGITALITAGFIGSGRIWLFFLSILACLLLGVRAGVITLVLNGMLMAAQIFIVAGNRFPGPDGNMHLTTGTSLVISITFVFLNTISTIALGLLVKGIEDKLSREIQITRELRESRNTMAQALDGSSVAAYILDPEHRITHWNHACTVISGVSREQAIGTKNHWSLFYDEKKPMISDYVLSVMRGKGLERDLGEEIGPSSLVEGAYEGEICIERKKNDPRWYLRTAAPLFDMEGSLIGAIETVMDISRLKSVEEQLYKIQKMESIGRLAGGVAHDYNNISSIIIGYTELCLSGMKKENPLYPNLEEILRAAEKSANITRQLLTFARKQQVAPKALNINVLIADMHKMLKRLIGENISLDFLPGDELWPVMLDPTQVDQVLANLCINARDAIADVGRIQIRTENVILREDHEDVSMDCRSGDYVLLSVSDNGMGMEPDVMENIFEPFYTTKDVGKGTGLGLATVYGIIRQNGGCINVSSEPGGGTVFQIYLKRFEGESGPCEVETENALPMGNNETILIMEDDLSILNLSERLLADKGYHLISGSSPSETLRMVKGNGKKIDLLITDVIMPEMNGKDFSEKLKAFFPEMKVLFMSGYSLNVLNDRGILDGDADFISKPFSRQDFVGKVQSLLN